MRKDRLVAWFAWLMAVVVAALAVMVWGQSLAWQFSSLTAYSLFPLFGLLAFSLMWTHYIAGAVRRLKGVSKSAIQNQLTITGYIVLVVILLHPGILIWQLLRDGFGLPPGSYWGYVAQGNAWIATLGSICLVVFLAYELKPWLYGRTWWHWVARAGDAAMLAIFYHGLKLGSQTQTGWYYWVWWFYGVTLVSSLAVIYYVDKKAGHTT